jgi:hypothetical protein
LLKHYCGPRRSVPFTLPGYYPWQPRWLRDYFSDLAINGDYRRDFPEIKAIPVTRQQRLKGECTHAFAFPHWEKVGVKTS